MGFLLYPGSRVQDTNRQVFFRINNMVTTVCTSDKNVANYAQNCSRQNMSTDVYCRNGIF